MPRHDIPATVEEILDDNATFEPAALAAVRKLARSKPWAGDDGERLEKLTTCLNELVAAYAMEPVRLMFMAAPPEASDAGYVRQSRTIVLKGKLSVVSFLHVFAAVRGNSPRACYRWSINLFRKCFPRSYASCQHQGPNLVAGGPAESESE